MGMFDKDKEIGRQLHTVFNFGDEFILFGVKDGGEVRTEIGDAKKTVLEVARKDDPQERFEVSTLASAIAAKAAEAEASDFPAVVQLLKVPSNFGGTAVVLQFVRPFNGQ